MGGSRLFEGEVKYRTAQQLPLSGKYLTVKIVRHLVKIIKIINTKWISYWFLERVFEKKERKVSALKTHHMFSVHTTAEKFENAIIKDRFGFVFMEKKITDYLILSFLESFIF